jgi:excisionase family DNA binding protein
MSTANGTVVLTVKEAAKRLALFTSEVLEKVEAGELESVRYEGNPQLFVRLPAPEKPHPAPALAPPPPAPKVEKPKPPPRAEKPKAEKPTPAPAVPEPKPAPIPEEEVMPNDLITPTQAAKLVKTHVSTIFRWIHRGRLPAFRRAGSRFLIRLSDLRGVLEPTRPSPTQPTENVLSGEACKQFLRSRGYKIP